MQPIAQLVSGEMESSLKGALNNDKGYDADHRNKCKINPFITRGYLSSRFDIE